MLRVQVSLWHSGKALHFSPTMRVTGRHSDLSNGYYDGIVGRETLTLPSSRCPNAFALSSRTFRSMDVIGIASVERLPIDLE